MAVDPAWILRLSRRFNASPERVFDAWLDPETARKWLFATPTDEAYSVDLDTRVGGKWTISARREGVDYTAIGEYLEIERPRRLVFTFGMPQFSPEFCHVIVEIAPDGTGSVLSLTQENLPPEFHSDTEGGWDKMFDALAAALG